MDLTETQWAGRQNQMSGFGQSGPVRATAAILLCILLTSCARDSRPPLVVEDYCVEFSNGQCLRYGASPEVVLMYPDTFAGKRVELAGWVEITFEGSAVYDDTLSAAQPKLGIFLDYPSVPNCMLHGHGAVVGRFDPTSRGHLGQWGGFLAETSLLFTPDTSCVRQ